MSMSDELFEAEETIREGIQHYLSSAEPIDPELQLVVDLIHAVRMMPGQDVPPGSPNTFAEDLAGSLGRYQARRLHALPS